MTGTDRATLRQLVEEGNEAAAGRLAALASADGDVETLKYLIDAGNESAGDLLARLAAAKGDLETLDYLIDNGVASVADERARMLVAPLAACSSGRPATEPKAVPVSPATRLVTAPASPATRLVTTSFCVGVSPAHPAHSTKVVHLRWLRRKMVLAEADSGLSTRVTVQIPPGPFVVEIDGVRQMTGTAVPGSSTDGSSGRGCPPASG